MKKSHDRYDVTSLLVRVNHRKFTTQKRRHDHESDVYDAITRAHKQTLNKKSFSIIFFSIFKELNNFTIHFSISFNITILQNIDNHDRKQTIKKV